MSLTLSKLNCIKFIKSCNRNSVCMDNNCNLFSTTNKLRFKHQQCPVLEEAYLCNPQNKNEICYNIKQRKGVGDIEKVLELYSQFRSKNDPALKELLVEEMLKIPNRTHPRILNYGETPHIVGNTGVKRYFDFKPLQFHNLAKSLNVLKNDLSTLTGHRSYFFTSRLAELESALVKYSLSKLLSLGFQIISVPDILPRSDIESCGMETHGKRSQVYSLDSEKHGSDHCLSGTAEMALAGYLMNKNQSTKDLPLRLVAVSRCFRAETSRTSDERGIYRVHQFTKVEMFGVTAPEYSSSLLEEFREFQEQHFESLGLHLRTLDMPPHELGAQAYRKYDVEAWLPGKNMWAEVSSCSDCTDYQSRRLNIHSDSRFLHTVNGTAAAIPRLVIALFETHQQPDGSVLIPLPLQPYMKNCTVISRENTENMPQLRPIKRLSKKSH